MRKWFALLVITSFLVLPPLPTSASFSSASAQIYLAALSGNPCITMGLSVLGASSIPSDYLKTIIGTTAIDYEAPILAITSINQNPHTFGSEDYIAKLKSFSSGGQIGDPATINDDIFGILALLSAGEPSNDTVVDSAKSFIFSKQNTNGGWGFAVGGSSDSNMTAAAVVALVAVGVPASDSHITMALDYLKTAQNDDGGFTYDPASSFGTASDSSSTAWAVWALNSLSIDPLTWSKSGNSPIGYLEGNQTTDGYFKYQQDSTEDAFSANTTAYAVIALSGKFLPVHIITNTTTSSTKKFTFRIEGNSQTVCSGQAPGPTALDIVKDASSQCGFTYNIQSTSFGPYLNQINNDLASGATGWLYLVDDTAPNVGAADYQLQTGDEVLWYYGEYGALPMRLSISSTSINSGQQAVVTVESFNNNVWSAVMGANVYFGAGTASTDSSGQATLTPSDGFYKINAQKSGFIRSNSVALKVGQPSSSSVNLSANVVSGEVAGESTSTISFIINPNSLDFGTIHPGQTANKILTVSNNGTADILLAAQISGDPLFIENIFLDSSNWQDFQSAVGGSSSKKVAIKLNVPSAVSQGVKPGQLIFWASEK